MRYEVFRDDNGSIPLTNCPITGEVIGTLPCVLCKWHPNMDKNNMNRKAAVRVGGVRTGEYGLSIWELHCKPEKR